MSVPLPWGSDLRAKLTHRRQQTQRCHPEPFQARFASEHSDRRIRRLPLERLVGSPSRSCRRIRDKEGADRDVDDLDDDVVRHADRWRADQVLEVREDEDQRLVEVRERTQEGDRRLGGGRGDQVREDREVDRYRIRQENYQPLQGEKGAFLSDDLLA